MSADVIRFPGRRSRVIWLLHECAGGWLLLVGSSGWLYGDLFDAIAAAQWMSANLGGLPIRMRVPA
jgi:hypothetical protein